MPYLIAGGPFGSRQQPEELVAAGQELRFEPDMIARHGYGGWPMRQHARHHTGFSMPRSCQLHDDARHARRFELGHSACPSSLDRGLVTVTA